MDLSFLSRWEFIVGLVVGGIIGLLLSFMLDWLFWSKRYQAYQSEVDQLQDALNRALNKGNELQQQVDHEYQRAVTAEEHNRQLQTQLQDGEKQQQKAKDQLDRATVRLRQMTAIEQANETLRNKLSAAEARIREQDSKREQLERARSEDQTHNALLRQEVEELKTSVTHSEQKAHDLDGEKQQLRNQLAALEAEIATMGAHLDTAVEDVEQVGTLQEQLQQTQLENDRLRASLATATARAERMLQIEQENEAFQERLGLAEEELITVNNQVVAADVKLQNLADKLTDERMRVQLLEKKFAESGVADNQNAKLSAELDAAQLEIEGLRHEISLLRQPNMIVPDKLQAIKGIGDTFARRLNEANVFTYEQVAALSAEELTTIVQAKSFQAVEPERWIAEAKQLAENREAT